MRGELLGRCEQGWQMCDGFGDRHARMRRRNREPGADHAFAVAHRHGQANDAGEEFLIVDRIAALADLLELGDAAARDP